jgi:hypothetical protein
MTPYRRREVTLIAACLVALFCWVRFGTQSPEERVTDDDIWKPPFAPKKNSIFHKTPLWRTNEQNDVPAVPHKKAEQKPMGTVVMSDEREDSDEEFGRVQGPSNKANSTLGVRRSVYKRLNADWSSLALLSRYLLGHRSAASR